MKKKPVCERKVENKPVCHYCGEKFKRKFNLKNHMKTAHVELVQKLACPVCSQLVSNTSNLRVHIIRCHKGQKLKEKEVPVKFVKKSKLVHGRIYETNSNDIVGMESDTPCESAVDFVLEHLFENTQNFQEVADDDDFIYDEADEISFIQLIQQSKKGTLVVKKFMRLIKWNN